MGRFEPGTLLNMLMWVGGHLMQWICCWETNSTMNNVLGTECSTVHLSKHLYTYSTHKTISIQQHDTISCLITCVHTQYWPQTDGTWIGRACSPNYYTSSILLNIFLRANIDITTAFTWSLLMWFNLKIYIAPSSQDTYSEANHGLVSPLLLIRSRLSL